MKDHFISSHRCKSNIFLLPPPIEASFWWTGSMNETGQVPAICFLAVFLGHTRRVFLGAVGRVDVVVSEL